MRDKPAGGRAGRRHDPEPRADRRAGARAATSWPVGQGCRRRSRPPSRCAAAIPCPRSATPPSLRAALLAADEIHFPDPAQATAGIHFAKVMRELGVWSRGPGRLRPAPNGATAMRALAASKAAGRSAAPRPPRSAPRPASSWWAPAARLRPHDGLYAPSPRRPGSGRAAAHRPSPAMQTARAEAFVSTATTAPLEACQPTGDVPARPLRVKTAISANGRSSSDRHEMIAGHTSPARPAVAGRPGIARGGPAAAARQAVALGRAFDHHGAFREADEADMAAAADPLAGAAVAKALDQGLAFRPVAQRAALTSAGHRHAALPPTALARSRESAANLAQSHPYEEKDMAVVETERHGQVLVVRMNRPERLNALSTRDAQRARQDLDRVPPQQGTRGRDLHRHRPRLLRRRGHEGIAAARRARRPAARRSRTRS